MAILSLFNQQSASDIFDHFLAEISKEINSKNNDYILNVDEAQWKQHFIDKYDNAPLEVYADQAEVIFKGKGKKSIEQYGRRYEMETYNFDLRVPFTGWSYLFGLAPSQRVLHDLRADVPNGNEGFISSTFTLNEQNEQKFEYEKRRLIKAITDNIPYINSDFRHFQERVGSTFDTAYAEKKRKVLAENSFFEKINIKINRDTEQIYKVPSAQKRKVPEPVVDKQTPAKYTQTPALPDDFYNDVLDKINLLFKSVEKKPSIYSSKDEESLRDYVLPVLEMRYENVTVTGETFNKGGKTDILVKYKDGTNLFVAECKFWKGSAQFHETINQLFDRYLTWRDSKVAIILFVKNKEFSKVLETIRDSVKKHPYFVRENGQHGESSFSYIFHFPTDKGKHVFAEIMAFHFPGNTIEE